MPTRDTSTFVIPDVAEGRAGIGLDLFASQPIDSRHPWRSRCAPPAASAFAILQTQSGSALRADPE